MSYFCCRISPYSLHAGPVSIYPTLLASPSLTSTRGQGLATRGEVRWLPRATAQDRLGNNGVFPPRHRADLLPRTDRGCFEIDPDKIGRPRRGARSRQ